MKRRILSFFISLISFSLAGTAQFESAKQVYESPKLKEEIAKHKTVAILPFKATISYKRMPKNFDAEANKKEEESLSTNMQSGMYTYLLRKADKYSVTFQDVERTNALLKSAGVYEKLGELTQDSICKILKVDAVIKSTYAYEKTGSEGGAIVKTILLGAGTGKVGSGALTMQLYNGADGELLWRFYKEMNEDVLGSANQVMERMMRKVSRNFPYEK
ncbi:MAG: hypothetical protein EKK37_16935 [Sphingobacteriales bacterium]|nr:MAG: hypothetical protein EKK37_16935 [Sphingobacteriales bacterium]